MRQERAFITSSFAQADRRITGLYIHVPFCQSACLYCNFIRDVVNPCHPLMTSFVDRLISEIDRLARLGALSQVTTAYIGGGTPSFLDDLLISVVSKIRQTCPHLTSFTCEANPESCTHELLAQLACAGVNRMSFGVQSFNEHELETIGRIHSSAQAQTIINHAKNLGLEVSLDLMAGLPSQTTESFEANLKTALALSPDHISCYALSVEEKTPLEHLVKTGQVVLPNSDDVCTLLELGCERLQANGYVRYETSNYARINSTNIPSANQWASLPIQAAVSQHNMTYWHTGSYLGLGPGAVSRLYEQDFDSFMKSSTAQAAHKSCPSDLLYLGNRTHTKAWVSTNTPYVIHEQQPLLDRFVDYLILSLRTNQGASKAYLNDIVEICEQGQLSHARFASQILTCISTLIDLGLIEETEQCYQPTAKGWLLGNEIGVRLLEAAEALSD